MPLLGGRGRRDLVGVAGVTASPVNRAIAPARQWQGGLQEITFPRRTGDAGKPIPCGRERCKALQIRTIGGSLGRRPIPGHDWFADIRLARRRRSLAVSRVRRNQRDRTREHMKTARKGHGLLLEVPASSLATGIIAGSEAYGCPFRVIADAIYFNGSRNND